MTSCSERRADAGFGLLEMLAALLIVGLIAAMIAPRFTATGPRALAEDARAAVSILRAARLAAHQRDADMAVEFDADRSTLSAPALGLRHAFDAAVTVEFTVPATERDGPRARIRFFADGFGTGGRLVLRAGDAQRIIEAPWMGGPIDARP